MFDAYQELLAASAQERRDAYEAAAAELGTRGQFAEKDLWVCLTLELLFGASKPPCGMTFKGGTSLSKAHGLIQRFSEDLDIVLSPEGLGVAHDLEALRGQSRRHRDEAFEELRRASEAYVAGPLAGHLNARLRDAGWDAVRVDVDPEERQTLLLSYPSVYPGGIDYVSPAVRVECGPRSAHVPASDCSVMPYLAAVVKRDFSVNGVPTIKAERTFWEKVFILHGHHCRYRDDGIVPEERNRLSRHYYDVAVLFDTPAGENALADPELLAQVRSHNQLAFPSAWRRYEEGVPGRFLLVPQAEVRKAIETDYAQMQSMVYGAVSKFDWVMGQIERLQDRLNRPGPANGELQATSSSSAAAP